MRVNEHIALLTDRVLLVPYIQHHVPAYHAWMQDEQIREATASEPLSLEEEYAMQRSWRDDADKLTFIVCAAPTPSAGTSPLHVIRPGVEDADELMVGDVNLFVGDEDADSDDGNEEKGRVVGELEVMIARGQFQGRGLGRHILLTFMWYVLGAWEAVAREHGGSVGGRCAELLAFCAKIGAGNERSIRLFEGLAFLKTTKEPNYFGEWELRWLNDKTSRDKLMGSIAAEIGEPRVLRYGNPPDDR